MNSAGPETADETDGSTERPEYFLDCEVPLSDWPPLLAKLIKLWGRSVEIDPHSAASILLTIVGGVAGNSVSLSVKGVGVVGPDLQLAINRDNAPKLRRGIQRAVAGMEFSIMAMLSEFEHLSDPRSQRNELASLETRLAAACERGDFLKATVEDERAMMNATLKLEADRILADYEAVKAEIAWLAARLRSLRFRMSPMTLVPEVGVAEIELLDQKSHDRALLELATSPGYFRRLLELGEKALSRLASFRRNTVWCAGIEYAGGSYKPRSSVSTIVLEGHDEILMAWGDRTLRNNGILEELLICSPSRHLYPDESPEECSTQWSELIGKLFARRLDRVRRQLKLEGAAVSYFDGRLVANGDESSAMDGRWLEKEPSLIAKVALCLALMRDEDSGLVSLDDVRIGAWIVHRLIETTRVHIELAENQHSLLRGRGAEKVFREPEIVDPVAVMVRKLRKLGACSRRTLFRSYSSQDYHQLEPVLLRAIGLGHIEVVGKVLRLVGDQGETCQRQLAAASV